MSTSRIIHSYTDFHDVDEDRRTISIQGGEWPAGNTAGIMVRFVIDSPSSAWDTVASSYIQKYEIIRILMMSTKTR